jgi:hypothetical protein
MVRDGRDVAVSAKSSIFNHFHIYYSAMRWQREQRTGLDWLAKLPPEQILLLKYEELIARPESAINRVCGFLDVSLEKQMLEYHRTEEARKSGRLSISWGNTALPVIRDNAHKYRQHLTHREIMQFEAIAWQEMEELNYQPDHPLEQLMRSREDMIQERFYYRLTECWLKLKAELNHLLKDRNSLTRLKKNLFMTTVATLRRFASCHA